MTGLLNNTLEKLTNQENKTESIRDAKLDEIVANFKRDQIKVIYRDVKLRKICCVIAVLFSINGLYILYWKVTEKTFDLNFYFILAGVLYLLSMIRYFIEHLRPSFIESQKNKICEIDR